VRDSGYNTYLEIIARIRGVIPAIGPDFISRQETMRKAARAAVNRHLPRGFVEDEIDRLHFPISVKALKTRVLSSGEFRKM
jgi:hypothetical protein